MALRVVCPVAGGAKAAIACTKFCTWLFSNTSPSSLRYLTRLGINQEKSNLASAPAKAAWLVMRMSSPVHYWANTSIGSIVGRPPGRLGSCSRTRWPSVWSRMTVRNVLSAPRICAKAGSGVSARRSGVVLLSLDLRPKRLPARSKSWVLTSADGASLSWCARLAGSAAIW